MTDYHLAYSHARGFGSISLTLTARIRSWDDVQFVKKMIEDRNPGLGSVCILSWQRYEDAP